MIELTQTGYRGYPPRKILLMVSAELEVREDEEADIRWVTTGAGKVFGVEEALGEIKKRVNEVIRLRS